MPGLYPHTLWAEGDFGRWSFGGLLPFSQSPLTGTVENTRVTSLQWENAEKKADIARNRTFRARPTAMPLVVLCLATTILCPGCMQATDPGLDARYHPEFTAPADIAGKIFHWQAMPVKVRHNSCTVGGCSGNVEAAVKRGVSFWQKNASLYGEIQTVYGEPADINIVYSTSLPGNIIGVCSASLAQNEQTGQYLIVTRLKAQSVSER